MTAGARTTTPDDSALRTEYTELERVRPRVLVADPVASSGLEVLQRDAEVAVRPRLSGAELLRIIPEFDALLVRSATRVTADVLRAGRKLRVVGRAGVGVDNIDVDAATRLGIVIVNAPGATTYAAAEHTMALLLALARHVPQAQASVLRGEWRTGDFVGQELRRKTLGIVGLGRIGSAVARCASGFEMRLLACDPFIAEQHAHSLGVLLCGLEELLRESDFVTLHAPLSPSNRHLIGACELSLLKPTAMLVNCARGEVLDEQALAEALAAGRLAGAALDVFRTEPLPREHALRRLPNVVLTPHLGAATREAQIEVSVDIAGQVLAVLRGEPVPGVVNAPMILTEDEEFLRPYVRLVEVLGAFLSQLAQARMETLELTYSGEIGEYDVGLLTAAAIKGLLAPVSEERVNLVNARLVARGRGLRVVEHKETTPESNYANLVSLRLREDGSQRLVAGTLLQSEARIVRIDQYSVDIEPSGHLLLTHHLDRPGMIGRVGTLLGACDINISAMQVGRLGRRGEAIMVLNVDEPLTPEMLNQIAEFPDVWSVRQVSL